MNSAALSHTIIGAHLIDTLRTMGSIERDMDLASSERFRGIASVIEHYSASDTIADSTYALIGYLTALPDPQYKRLAVGMAINADTTSWARSILDSIPMGTADDSIFYDYHDLAIDLKDDTLTWFQMDSSQLVVVDDIANGNSSIKHLAEAVKMLLNDTMYVRMPEQLPEEPSAKMAEEESQEDIETKLTASVKVYPNPFHNQFNVAWELQADAAYLQFEVFDLAGRIIHYEQIAATKIGQHVLNLGPCNGFYILRVSENGKQLSQQKLLCIGD